MTISFLKLSLLLFSYSVFVICEAQNLIPNSSFEEGSPIGGGVEDQFKRCDEWNNFLSVDYHHGNQGATAPGSLWGYQEPFEGERMAGLRAFDLRVDDHHEFIYVSLNSPLEAEKVYFVSFRVSPSEGVQFVTDDLGACLTKEQAFFYREDFFDLDPQITNKEGNYLDDVTKWYEISGFYKAIGNEEILVIGNFKRDAETTWIDTDDTEGEDSAYFFVDQVVVEKCPAMISLEIPNDTTVCDREFLLDVFDLGANYQWNTGSTESSLKITESGMYSVKLEQGGCYLEDSILVNLVPIKALGQDRVICNNTEVILDVTTPNGFYQWSDGSTNSTLKINRSGLYWVDIESDICTFRDSINIAYAKEDFSIFPNPSLGEFTIKNSYQPIDQINIYDAIGRLIYERLAILSNEINLDLTGNLPIGVYLIQTNTKGCLTNRKIMILDSFK